MSDFLRCLVGMFAVVAPFGALATLIPAGRRNPDADGQGWGPSPRWPVAFSPPAAFAVLAVAALLNGPVLDALKVSPESFQFAAGAVMAPLAVRLMLAGNSMPAPEGPPPGYAWLVPLAVPLLAGPSSIIAAISYAARFGAGDAILASAIVATLTAALFALSDRFDRLPLIVVQTISRLSGGLLVLIAVELAIDGVHSV